MIAFQFTFHQGGTIELKWGTCTITDCMVGFGLGHGQTDPGTTDVSALTVAIFGDGVKPLTLSSLAGDRPILGTTFDMQVREIPATATIGAMIYSWTQRNPGTDLTSIGMAGCFQHLDIDASFIFVASGSTAKIQFGVPNVPMLVGWHVYTQAVVLGATTTTLGALSSNGGDMLIDVN